MFSDAKCPTAAWAPPLQKWNEKSYARASKHWHLGFPFKPKMCPQSWHFRSHITTPSHFRQPKLWICRDPQAFTGQIDRQKQEISQTRVREAVDIIVHTEKKKPPSMITFRLDRGTYPVTALTGSLNVWSSPRNSIRGQPAPGSGSRAWRTPKRIVPAPHPRRSTRSQPRYS